jgi:putative ABC transport system permease protein
MSDRVDVLAQDIRFALRAFRRHSGLLTATVGILAIGIGISTALFSVIHSQLFESVNADAERLVLIWASERDSQRRGLLSPDELEASRTWGVFDAVAAYGRWAPVLTVQGQSVWPEAWRVSPALFRMLGVTPVIGHLPVDVPGNESNAASTNTAILGQKLWREWFAAAPDIVGRTIVLNDRPFTVLAVMPTGFSFPVTGDLWIVSDFGQTDNAIRGRYLRVLATLSTGMSLSQAKARAEATSIASPDGSMLSSTRRLSVGLFADEVISHRQDSLVRLAAATGLILLTCCTTVAVLSLARSSTRVREMTTRTILGASRSRLIRQLITEAGCVCGAAGALGVAASAWMVKVFMVVVTPGIVQLREPTANGRIMLIALAVSVITCVLFSLAPVLYSSLSPHCSLMTDCDPRRAGRARSLCLVAQFALAVVVAIQATLLFQSMVRLRQVDPGFVPRDLISVQLRWPGVSQQAERAPVPLQRLLSAVKELPGVQSAAVGTSPPFAGQITMTPLTRAEESGVASAAIHVSLRFISSGYFQTAGISLLRGRDFGNVEFQGRDLNIAERGFRTAVVTESLADSLWGSADPLGRRVSVFGVQGVEVVGVVADVHQRGLELLPDPAIFLPLSESVTRVAYLLVRSTPGAARRASSVVAEQLRELDRLPSVTSSVVEELMADSVRDRILYAKLMAMFAVISLLLAMLTSYSVMLCIVRARHREIAIRISLGAGRYHIARAVLYRSALLEASGVLLGLGLSVIGFRIVAGVLFGVRPVEPLVYASITVGVLLSGIIAASVPALRLWHSAPLRSLNDAS